MAGRPQTSVRDGATYALAKFINANWDTLVGRTNEEVSQELGYRAANIISMWRTGKTKIPLDRLPDIANLMKIDIATLFPMWMEQYFGEREDIKFLMKEMSARFARSNEKVILELSRKAFKGNDVPLTPTKIRVIEAVLADEDIANKLATHL